MFDFNARSHHLAKDLARDLAVSSVILLAVLAGPGCLTVTSEDIEPPGATTGAPPGGPQATCVPKDVVFPPTPANHLATSTVVCTNTGTSPTGENLMISITGTGSPVFSAQFMAGTYPASGLAPNQKAQISLSYTPGGVSADQATLMVATNVGNVTIPLLGDGLAPSCQLSIATSELTFPDVTVGASSAPIAFAIENVGQVDCQIKAPIMIGDDSTGSFQVLSTSIQPNGSEYAIPPPGTESTSRLVIQVGFTPTTRGVLTGWVGDFVSLSGTGD
jgi:hypothetical protein